MGDTFNETLKKINKQLEEQEKIAKEMTYEITKLNDAMQKMTKNSPPRAILLPN